MICIALGKRIRFYDEDEDGITPTMDANTGAGLGCGIATA